MGEKRVVGDVVSPNCSKSMLSGISYLSIEDMYVSQVLLLYRVSLSFMVRSARHNLFLVGAKLHPLLVHFSRKQRNKLM